MHQLHPFENWLHATLYSGDVEAALASASNVARNVKVKLPSQVRVDEHMHISMSSTTAHLQDWPSLWCRRLLVSYDGLPLAFLYGAQVCM